MSDEDRGAADTAFDARRMGAIAYVAGSIAHDIANPLAGILIFAASLATDSRLPLDVRESADLVRHEAETTQRLVRALLEVVRVRAPGLAVVPLHEVVGDVVDACKPSLLGVVTSVSMPPRLPLIETDPWRLRHLVLVLVVDAIRALGPQRTGGRLHVAAQSVTDGIRLEISVERGPGADGSWSDPAQEVRAVAASLGGRIESAATAAGGRMALELPVAAASAARAAAAPAASGGRLTPASVAPSGAARPSGAQPVVLVCDDEAVLRSLIARHLARAGITVHEAQTGGEALALLGHTAVDVVLADHHLRDMTGVRLHELAIASMPELRGRFVLMSGDPGATELQVVARKDGVPVLAKPFDLQVLTATVRELAVR